MTSNRVREPDIEPGTSARAPGEPDEPFDWHSLRPRDEPSRHRAFWFLVVVCLVFGTPWWQPAEFAERLVGGLPLWVVTSLLGALGLALTTAYASLRWWRDADSPETPSGDASAADAEPAGRSQP